MLNEIIQFYSLNVTIKGAQVVMACRDMKKAQEACDKIRSEANSKSVFIEKLDLSSLDSVREFATNFKAKYHRLDILINNAGNKALQISKNVFFLTF